MGNSIFGCTMLSFNKEEAHNLNPIKEKRTEGRFAITEFDTRGYYLGVLAIS